MTRSGILSCVLACAACSDGSATVPDASAPDGGVDASADAADASKTDASADASGADAGSSCFVTRSGADLSLAGAPFAFVGANLRGIAFHPSADIDAQLVAADSLGMRVIRVFAVKNDRSAQQVGDALANLFARGKAVAPKLTFILSLEDFYATGFSAQGDDGAYVNGLLAPAWFTGGYKTNYKPEVLALAARFATEPRVFAWEIGNELSAGSAGAGAMLDFAYDVGFAIKNAGVKQMVTTGFIDVNHAIGGGVTDAILAQFYAGPYKTWTKSPFDLGIIHAYNNEQQPGNAFGYQLQDHDIAWFMANAMPYVVGEGGFNGGGNVPCTVFPGAQWDGVAIPNASSDRAPATKATIDRFFTVKGADGWMQWGLMTGTDNGEGDRCSGMDTVFHGDWSTLASTFQARAAQLPSGGQPCP
jgi:hypothetical protein